MTTTIDEQEISRSITYSVNQVEMSISAINFNPATVRTTDFTFAYRCMGSGLTKQVHFLIDGNENSNFANCDFSLKDPFVSI